MTRRYVPPLVLIAAVVLGVSTGYDLNGTSMADTLMIRLGGLTALKIFLWIEGGLFAAAVAWLGLHVVTAGFAITRSAQVNMFGLPLRVRTGVFPSSGYIFVILGAAMVALAITSLAVLNSCRYMQLV